MDWVPQLGLKKSGMHWHCLSQEKLASGSKALPDSTWIWGVQRLGNCTEAGTADRTADCTGGAAKGVDAVPIGVQHVLLVLLRRHRFLTCACCLGLKHLED